MKIRISALLLAATLLLAACGSNSSSAPEASSGSESAPSQSSAPNGGVFSHLIRDGKFVLPRLRMHILRWNMSRLRRR